MPRVVRILGGFLLCAAMCFVIHSCKNWPYQHHNDNYDTADSTWVAEFVEQTHNPNLLSVQEVLILQQKMFECNTIDSAFLAMPTEVLKNVSTVLLKKNKSGLTKKDIVEEFRQHADIYKNLPNSKATSENVTKPVDLTATDLGSRRDGKIISENYSFRTDTVNGKPVRIKVTTTESYE